MKLRYVVLPLFAVLTLNGCYSLMGAFVSSGILAAVALPSFEGAREKGRNAQVSANANTLRMALEQYAVDHEGTYPPGPDWLGPLVAKKPGYLPGDRLAANPYGKPRQANALGLADVPVQLPGPGGNAKAGLHTKLGPGKRPGAGPYDALTYGALIYGLDAAKQEYVLYGVGERNGQAVIVFAVSSAE